MKAGQTQFDVGAKVKVVSIYSADPDERQGMIDMEGELTHPFGDMPGTALGVYVTTWGRTTPGAQMLGNRAGLCRGDKFKIVGHGKKVFTVR